MHRKTTATSVCPALEIKNEMLTPARGHDLVDWHCIVVLLVENLQYHLCWHKNRSVHWKQNDWQPKEPPSKVWCNQNLSYLPFWPDPMLCFIIDWTQYWVWSLKYPTGRKFSLKFKFCYFVKGKFIKFKSRLFFRIFFKNLSMVAYIIEIQKSKFSNI